MKNQIEAYGKLVEVAPNLYCIDGEWGKTLFKRRMTIVRIKDELVIHSAIRLKEEDYDSIDNLGKVTVIVVPNAFHNSEAHFYAKRYPSAKILVSPASIKRVRKHCRVDGVLPQAWPAHYKSELDCFQFVGTRILSESVFLHHPTRTLITTDLVFNMQNELHGVGKLLFKMNRIYKNFGPSRVFKRVFVNDKARAAASFKRILDWDFERVIMSHGDIVHGGGKQALAASIPEFLRLGSDWLQ